MNTVEKYSARLQAMKEEMDGITPEIKATRATEAKRKKDAAYSVVLQIRSASSEQIKIS